MLSASGESTQKGRKGGLMSRKDRRHKETHIHACTWPKNLTKMCNRKGKKRGNQCLGFLMTRAALWKFIRVAFFPARWNLSSRTLRMLVATATRIWGESGLLSAEPCLASPLSTSSCYETKGGAELSTLWRGWWAAWPAICLMSEHSHPVARPYVSFNTASLPPPQQRRKAWKLQP